MRALIAACFVTLVACGSSGIDVESVPQRPAGAGGEDSAGAAGKPAAGSAGTTSAGQGGASAGSSATGGAPVGGQNPGGSLNAGMGGALPIEPCQLPPACNAEPPDPGQKRDWVHTTSQATSTIGSPNHRGRDLFLLPDEDQWIIGKFAYGLNDKDIHDEEVDLYLLRDCGDTWEKLGTAKTTTDGQHDPVEGVDDSGGRVFYKIPKSKALGVGRHRVHMVVAGDLTSTELFIEVIAPTTKIFVSDVDGTLTTSENVEFVKLLQGDLPDAHVDAGAALTLLAERGYRPMYITARPEFLVQRTRDFVRKAGLPEGIIHTTLTLTGQLGSGAQEYKTKELELLAKKNLVPSWVFGNKATDAGAYESAGVKPVDHRIFYQYKDVEFGGREIQEYTELLGEFALLPNVCSGTLQ